MCVSLSTGFQSCSIDPILFNIKKPVFNRFMVWWNIITLHLCYLSSANHDVELFHGGWWHHSFFRILSGWLQIPITVKCLWSFLNDLFEVLELITTVLFISTSEQSLSSFSPISFLVATWFLEVERLSCPIEGKHFGFVFMDELELYYFCSFVFILTDLIVTKDNIILINFF